MFNLRKLPVIGGLVVAVAMMSEASMVAAQVTATSGDPRTIAAIAASVAAIDRDLRRYTSTTHELEHSMEGGEVRRFFDGVVLRKLTIQSYGESGRAHEEHYYSSERLVFVREVTELYDEQLSGRVRVRIKHALYFSGGKLIRHIRRQTPALPGQDFAPWDPDISQLLRLAEDKVVCARSASAMCVAPAR